MIEVLSNNDWCLCIFRYLLKNPDEHDNLNFRSEYFEGKNPETRLPKLYDSVRKMITELEFEYSYKTLEIAFFEYVETDLKQAYYCDDIVDKTVADRMRIAKEQIKNIYNTSETLGSSVSDDFWREKAEELCMQQSMVCKFRELQTAYVTYLSDPNITTRDCYNNISNVYKRCEEKYKEPCNASNIYTSFFNKNLLRKVSEEVYTTSIYHLDKFMSGGWHKQTVTGFLTKTGGGKSTILFTLAANALKTGKNIAFINLEMEDHYVNANIMSAISKRYDYKTILNNLTDENIINDLQQEFSQMNLGQYTLISDRNDDIKVSPDMSWLDNKIKNAENKISKEINKEDFKFDIIFIDYLYLMNASKRLLKSARTDELYRQITIEAHKYAQDNDYCVVTVFQGNRGAEQKLSQNQRINLADTGDSYGAMRDIEYVFSIERYSDITNDKDGILITPLKTRHYDGEYCSIYLPYKSSNRCYDSRFSEIIEFEEPSVDPSSTTNHLKFLFVCLFKLS